MCLESYQLDPCCFVSTPGLALEALLKHAKVEVELLTDVDMIIMNEIGIRGGITQLIKKYSSANNKYMPNYNPKVLSNFLMHLDANNLYGYAMRRKLPLNKFKWVDNANELITKEFMLNYNEETNDTRYLLDEDIEYPKELHNNHSDFPFLPVKNKLNKSTTRYSKAIQNERKRNSKFLPKQTEKLLCTLEEKDRYIAQITLIQQALKYGLELKKVHRAISFYQSKFLKPYIMLNTNLRKNAKNEFEKDFFKLMNNAVFGKTMENVRERRNINLVATEEKRKLLTSQPNFVSSTIFSENLEPIEMRKTHILMNKPIAIGQATLDKSKELMYKFHYEIMKPMYGDKLQLLYMDTDSFFYDIQTEDFDKDIAPLVQDWFDTSSYSKDLDRPSEIGQNHKEICKYKDELSGKILIELVGITPEIYEFKHIDTDNYFYEQKKCKGTVKHVVKRQLILIILNKLFSIIKHSTENKKDSDL